MVGCRLKEEQEAYARGFNHSSPKHLPRSYDSQSNLARRIESQDVTSRKNEKTMSSYSMVKPSPSFAVPSRLPKASHWMRIELE